MDIEQKAARAQATLEHLKEAFTEIRGRHLSAFENCAVNDVEAQSRAKHMLQALKELRMEIETPLKLAAMQSRKVGKRD